MGLILQQAQWHRYLYNAMVFLKVKYTQGSEKMGLVARLRSVLIKLRFHQIEQASV